MALVAIRASLSLYCKVIPFARTLAAHLLALGLPLRVVVAVGDRVFEELGVGGLERGPREVFALHLTCSYSTRATRFRAVMTNAG